jgi:hypothetical protein
MATELFVSEIVVCGFNWLFSRKLRRNRDYFIQTSSRRGVHSAICMSLSPRTWDKFDETEIDMSGMDSYVSVDAWM